MITYLYWFAVIALALMAFWGVGVGARQWLAALGVSMAILLIGWLSHHFYFEQMFVKRWGGVMSIDVPKGQQHMGVTWKDDHLWIENYDPVSNVCEFREYSRGDLLEGRVLIKNCNPLKQMAPQ